MELVHVFWRYYVAMLKLLGGMEFPGAPDAEVQAQPAGFDLTLQRAARFQGPGELDFSNQRRNLPEAEDLPWVGDAARHDACNEGTITLKPGGYLVTYNEQITVPPDCAGLVLPRSSLMRCGATLHSALWDPGYCGRGQGLLSVYNELILHRNARIGQFILLALESAAANLYRGQYQGENL